MIKNAAFLITLSLYPTTTADPLSADKWSAVVVWGIEQYRREVYKQLGEPSVYELVQNNLVEIICKRVYEKLDCLKNKGSISGDNRKYLSSRDGKLGRLFLLPKIHKRLIDVPGRPVISNCGTPTGKLSEFVDFHLQPIIKILPFIIKNTTDFLCKLERLDDIPDNAIICSMDVGGLYLHIPHGEGLNSMKEIIEEFVSKSELNNMCIGAGGFSRLENKRYFRK